MGSGSMQLDETTVRSGQDQLSLSVWLARPEGKAKGIVQIAHGMSEHKERYEDFIRFLCEHGFVVLINIDNVLRFVIAKKVGNIHPIITVIGVVIGIPLFGILGLVFGPLLLSYFILLIKIYETSAMASERLERIKTISEHDEL